MTERSAGATSKMKGCRGFTLFEMVIAVSIFAIIGVIAFGGLGQMTRTGQAVSDANERLSDMQFAVAYFNRDWSQVSPRKIRNQYGDEEHNIVISDAAISFTRSGWSNLLGHKRSTLQRVQYLQVDDQLVRRHWRSLDQGIGEKPLQVVLLDDIEGVEIEFVDALGQPIRTWPIDTGSNTGAPIVLMLRLDLDGIGEITRLLEIPDGVL
ncbi:MAG: type II secretion system minor pseudopilin GspJ [Gammaproteobacteria bacterium]|nr:type II secretion system minor pseudopilin GspJ [Gammaproteobacteria bacterium]